MRISRTSGSSAFGSQPFRRRLFVSIAILLPNCGTPTPSDDETTRLSSPLLHGTLDSTSVPNVGTFGFGSVECTATSIAGQWVLTAGHCSEFYNVNQFQPSNLPMVFQFPNTSTALPIAVYNMAPQLVPFVAYNTYLNTFGVALSSTPTHNGNADIALVMLDHPVPDPTTGTVTSLVTLPTSPPATGSSVTSWGVGQTSIPGVAGQRNRFTWSYAPPTPYGSCPDAYTPNCKNRGQYSELTGESGDSGGPSFSNGTETLFAVYSSSAGGQGDPSVLGDVANFQPQLCSLMYNHPHRFCQIGAALGGEPAGCGPFVPGTHMNVVTAVVNQDQSCGTASWSQQCVDEAASIASQMDLYTCWAKKGSTFDGYSDIILSGNFPDGATSDLEVALSEGNGTFFSYAWSTDEPNFGSWATAPGVKSLAGDFNGDGFNDVALVNTNISNGTIAIAMEDPLPLTYHVTTGQAGGITGASPSPTPFHCGGTTFAGWATCPNVIPIAGDFDGDGKTDIALVGGGNYFINVNNRANNGVVPVAFSNGDGSFRITSTPDLDSNTTGQSPTTGSGAIQNALLIPSSVPIAGDFDGDGKTDIAVMPGEASGRAVGYILIGFSNGDGTFRSVYTYPPYTFCKMALWSGVKPIAGDFNGDGLADVALVGGSGWTTIPIVFSNGNTGKFGYTLTNNVVGNNFAVNASQPGVIPVAGDFDGNGQTDIALTGGAGWSMIPVAFSAGTGSFNVTNSPTDNSGGVNFPAVATYQGAIPLGASY